MRILIVEDDSASRRVMQKILSEFGECHIAVDGNEAIEKYKKSWLNVEPYDLICMDIMMPNIDGHEALIEIRKIEKEMGLDSSREVKVIMTTALDDPKNVVQAFYKGGATSYIVKPIAKKKLLEEIGKLGLDVKSKL